MKYVGEKYGEEKILRDCVFINKNNFDIIFDPDESDIIIDELKDVPEDCIYCDKDIAPIVRNLNRKGYNTVFSCQGHFDYVEKINDYFMSNMYVMFKLDEDNYHRYMRELFKLPPMLHFEVSDWFDDIHEEVINEFSGDPSKCKRAVTIYANHRYLGTISDQEDFQYFNRIELLNLKKWVDTLPDLTMPETSEALYDIRYIDHETAKQCGFDFESVQEYAEDIKESYNIAVDSIKEINEQMTIISDMVTHIGKRLAAMKVVEDIRNVDDTSMYESYDKRRKETLNSIYGFMNRK